MNAGAAALGAATLAASLVATAGASPAGRVAARVANLQDVRASEQQSVVRGDAVFTDEDLRERLRSHAHGVIYVWSPHMPFSVDGIEAIRDAAKRRDLAVTLVLHPGSDVEYARRSMEAPRLGGLDARARAAALRPLAANTLIERGMANHAPSIQLYRDGELLGPVLPGARGVEGYLEFIDSFAQAAVR